MATIIYFHGFASTGSGPKVDALRAAFPDDDVIAPNLPTGPNDMIALVNKFMRNITNFPVVFVGTSLGGFWANYFAHVWDVPAVIVNPATHPSATMAERVGVDLVNYATGEPIVISDADVKLYAGCETIVHYLYSGVLIHLFLAKDDDVLDYTTALSDMCFTKSTAVFEDGGHRFEKHWDKVIEKVKEVIAEKVAA